MKTGVLPRELLELAWDEPDAVGRARRPPRRALARRARASRVDAAPRTRSSRPRVARRDSAAVRRTGAGREQSRRSRPALVALGGLGMFLVVFELSRRGLLSLRYALGWMGVSVLLVVAGVLLVLVGGLSESLPFTPTGLLAAVGLAFVLLITLQLSISLSGHQEAIRAAERGERAARGAGQPARARGRGHAPSTTDRSPTLGRSGGACAAARRGGAARRCRARSVCSSS